MKQINSPQHSLVEYYMHPAGYMGFEADQAAKLPPNQYFMYIKY